MTPRAKSGGAKGTRVFRRPYATGSFQVSVQVGFQKRMDAVRFARRLDRIKAAAALRGTSFSVALDDALDLGFVEEE